MSKKAEKEINEVVEALKARGISAKNDNDEPVSTDILMEQLADKNFYRDQLNISLSKYLVDGNFNALFRTLDFIIRSQYSVDEFCEKAGIGRTQLYQMVTGTSVPKLSTLMKTLKVLGLDIKII